MSRPANFYFLCIAVLQSINAISISQGKPTILVPLIFVLVVSGIKDAFEDSKRHAADREENERVYHVLNKSTREWVRVSSTELQVGDFVKILDDETYPADIVMLFSPSPGQISYVETANLDGETNLKIKMVPDSARCLETEEDLANLTCELICDPPNGALDIFGGHFTIHFKGQSEESLLSPDNLLLRGSRLRNTEFIYGMVVYTGEESKIRRNSAEKSTSKVKRSSVEKTMNKQIFGMFGMQVLVCFFAGLSAGVWDETHKKEAIYLWLDQDSAVAGTIRFFTWFIIFTGFVPISLLVSMEMVKFFQGQFMGWDKEMSCIVENGEWQFARAQTSGLNEELGQVQFVLSDKTGTLTCNSMDFRKAIIGGVQYGTGETDISKAAKERAAAAAKLKGGMPPKKKKGIDNSSGSSDSLLWSAAPEKRTEEHRSGTMTSMEAEYAPHVNFNARLKLEAALSSGKVHSSTMTADEDVKFDEGNPMSFSETFSLEDEYLMGLALCNTVFPTADEHDPTKMVLKSSSPDEEALVEFARFMGYELHDRNPPHIIVKVQRKLADGSVREEFVKYEQLALLDFTSKRKRMTVVVRAPNGRIKVFSKGADNMMAMLLNGGSEDNLDALAETQPGWDDTVSGLTMFGDQGLRTLIVTSSDRDASWWDDPEKGWKKKYEKVMHDCSVEGPSEVGHFKGGCKDDCRRCEIENRIEIDSKMSLIGATAIEDKLQDEVPATIKAMLEGGMSVWVLTGDKLETAINIGMACNLLESEMEQTGNLLRITGETVNDVDAEISRHLDHIHRNVKGDALGLVVTSRAFSRIEKGGDVLLERFWSVAIECKSVVCCRMQPNQKAAIVRMVKDSSEDGVTTLAVGDGANDEQMIREADVGVGIRGVEGTTAVRAADYAISQFRFLRRLLFVHGRLSYRRIATLICYIFYKNSIICFAQLWFGIYSGFSGQPLFLEWAFQLYNVSFTALPILVFAVLDRDIDFDVLFDHPLIYKATSNGQLFNFKVFWKWMLLSLVQSVILFGCTFASYAVFSAEGDGRIHGLWSMGIVLYTVIVIVTNLKLALLMASWTWLHHLTIWGSIVFYFIIMIMFSSSPVFATAGADYYFLMFRLMGQTRFWATIFIAVLLAVLLDFSIQSYSALFNLKQLPDESGHNPEERFGSLPERHMSDAELYIAGPSFAERVEHDKERRLRKSMTLPVRRTGVHPTLSHQHTGFDFSHTSGQGKRLGFEY